MNRNEVGPQCPPVGSAGLSAGRSGNPNSRDIPADLADRLNSMAGLDLPSISSPLIDNIPTPYGGNTSRARPTTRRAICAILSGCGYNRNVGGPAGNRTPAALALETGRAPVQAHIV